jgi:hypothetical protein
VPESSQYGYRSDVVLNLITNISVTEAVDAAAPMSKVESRLHPMLDAFGLSV